MEKQLVLMDKWGGSGTSKVVADEIGSLPEYIACHGVEARVVGGSEAYVEASLFDNRRRRRVGIERMTILGQRNAMQSFLEQDLS